MMRTLGKALAASAATCLALAQPAAATTRSVDSIPTVSAPIERIGSSLEASDSEELGSRARMGGTWFVVVAVLIVAGIILAVELDEVDSPG